MSNYSYTRQPLQSSLGPSLTSSADAYRTQHVESSSNGSTLRSAQNATPEDHTWPLKHSTSSATLSNSLSNRKRAPAPLDLSPKSAARQRTASHHDTEQLQPQTDSERSEARTTAYDQHYIPQTPVSSTLRNRNIMSTSSSITSQMSNFSMQESDVSFTVERTCGMSRSESGELSNASSSPKSPRFVDRSKLVGLGELATPRWTAANRSTGKFEPLPSIASPAGPTSPLMKSPRLASQGGNNLFGSPGRPMMLGTPPSASLVEAKSAIEQFLADFDPDAKDEQLDARQESKWTSATDASLSSVPAKHRQQPLTLQADGFGLGLGEFIDSPASTSSTKPAKPWRQFPVSETVSPALSTPQRTPLLPTPQQTSHDKGPDGKASLLSTLGTAVDSPGTGEITDKQREHKARSPRTSLQSRKTPSNRPRASSAHHTSPAHIAHTILKTAVHAAEGVDMDVLAQRDDHTAEALRKLDGISPLKASRMSSGTSSLHQRDRESEKSRTGTPSSTRTSIQVDSRRSSTRQHRVQSGGSAKEHYKAALPPHSADASYTSFSDTQDAIPLPSPAVSSGASSPRVLNSAKRRPPSSADAASRRASGTAASADSPLRVASSPASTGRSSTLQKWRRNSGASDLSATSESSSRRQSTDMLSNVESRPHVPPVPPLPQTYQTGEKSPAGISPVSKQPVAVPATVAAKQDAHTPVATSEPLSPSSRPSSKWSISSAFGLSKSPSVPSIKQFSPSIDLNSPAEATSTLHQPRSLTRKGSKPMLSHSASMPQGIYARSRTTSHSSTGTDTHEGILEVDPKSTPRKTSSSHIPFFNRKSSASSKLSMESSPSAPDLNASPSTSSKDVPEREKSGRKSILGLTFMGRKGDRKSAATLAAPSTTASSHVPSSPLAKRAVVSDVQDVSVTTPKPPSSLAGRKRGKTLPSSNELPKSVPVQLPPMQISGITTATARRIQAMGPPDTKPREREEPTRQHRPSLISRPSRLLENSGVVPMPTITGSPSVVSKDKDKTGLIAATPTRIPRRGDAVASPKPVSALNEFGVLSPAKPSGTTKDRKVEPKESAVVGSMPSRPHKRSTSVTSVSSIPRSKSSSTALSSVTAHVSEEAKPTLTRSTRRLSLLPAAASRDPTPATPITNRTLARTSSVTHKQHASDLISPSVSSVSSSRTYRTVHTNVVEASASKTRTVASKPAMDPPPPRLPKSSTLPTLNRTASADRSGASSSSSRVTTPLLDDEAQADQEMAQFVRRQQSKKLSAGVPSSEIRQMFEFPEPCNPTPSMLATEVLKLYGRQLSPYEQEEILEHVTARYWGQNARKVNATKSNPHNNYGYDDDRGDYSIVMHDHILYRYEITGVLGKGSFGQVVQCRDHKTGEMVAVKIIRNKKRFHHQALIEIKVLENLREWDPDNTANVVKMTDHFSFRRHLCIVTELLSINLYELIKANSFRGFSTTLIRRFTAQMLNALVLLRSHRVVHCDLKPENVLLKHPRKSGVQVIDFGSSCFENEKVYTYIQSRFYRSIEVILGSNYHMAIDMWSLGCIMAELYTGMPLFPGEDEQEQLACIIEVLGVPDRHLVDKCSRRKVFFDSTGAPRPVVNSKGRRRRPGAKTLKQVLKCDDDDFVDFIAKCLIYDPERRMKPQGALRHPFIRPDIKAQIPVATPRSFRSSASASGSVSSSLTGASISTPRRKVSVTPGTVASTSTPSLSTLPYTHSNTAPVARVRQNVRRLAV